MKAEIPKKTLDLPISGIKVEFYEYLTTGESRQLQRILLQSNISFNQDGTVNNDRTVKGDSAVAFFNMQDYAIKAAFAKAYNRDGSEITVTDPLQFVSELAVDDGNIVYKEISDLINRSSMTADAKKN